MKALKLLLFPAVFLFFNNVHAQRNSSVAAERAIIFADSLLKSFNNNDLDQYTNLSYPGVISYYGGKNNFIKYLQRARAFNNSGISDNIRIIQMVNVVTEWQCVIQRTSKTEVDGKKAAIISYLVGQSKDEGQTWKFVDVGASATGSLVYIMPDISERLTVPRRQVIF
jgi:hypothetical protein